MVFRLSISGFLREGQASPDIRHAVVQHVSNGSVPERYCTMKRTSTVESNQSGPGAILQNTHVSDFQSLSPQGNCPTEQLPWPGFCAYLFSKYQYCRRKGLQIMVFFLKATHTLGTQ